MQIDKLTPDRAILAELGQRLARDRKREGWSQEALAREAGLGVATLRRIEDGGDARFGSWIKLLKALGREAALEALLPETSSSPMEEALGGRKRPRKKRGASEEPFRWGDEGP